jgi:hypothetical protein
VRNRIQGFVKRFNAKGKPFDWKFTRHDLRRRLEEYADRVLTRESADEYEDTG